MKKFASSGIYPSLLAFLLSCSFAVKAQVSVTTQHNDLKRTGWIHNENALSQINVNSSSFGKVFTRTVDDQIYTQPLVISNLMVKGKLHNVVFTATVNNSVYAFDAESDTANKPLWKVNLTPSGYRAIKNSDMTGACAFNYKDFSGNMGIVGTPVIDTNTKTLYVVARSISTNGAKTFVQYFHAIDILTGAEKPNSPVYITATISGSGDGSVGGQLTFNQQKQNQRPGLLLYNGVVYIAWASHCDWNPYHGWVIGYDAGSLQQKYVYNDTPDGSEGGIWMSGQAPAVDDQGFIYVSTGNGTVGKGGNPANKINRGESILKMSTASGSLKVVDFFTPGNYKKLEQGDLDYGVDGVLLIPNTTLSLSGSKESLLYMVNNNKMGSVSSNDSGAIQKININAENKGDHHLHGSPVYFKNYNGQEYIYAWAEGGLLKQVPFNRTTKLFDTANTITAPTALPPGMPGAMLALSSNQQQQGTGILWASHPSKGNANHAVVPGVLQAFDAGDVTHELWNSNQNANRDSVGKFAKFVCPTIANGKVYLATFSNQLVVYGLLSSSAITKLDNLSNPGIAGNAKLTLFPNPAQSQVFVEYKDNTAHTDEEVQVDIFNNNGNIIYQNKAVVFTGGIMRINISLPSTMQNGIYNVRVTNARGMVSAEKLVVSN